jgi:hypothetical protein
MVAKFLNSPLSYPFPAVAGPAAKSRRAPHGARLRFIEQQMLSGSALGVRPYHVMWFSVHSVTGCKKTDFVKETPQVTRS